MTANDPHGRSAPSPCAMRPSMHHAERSLFNGPMRHPRMHMNLVPELRRDPVTGYLVFVASARMGRPRSVSHHLDHEDNARADGVAHDGDCPFCEGNERATLSEVARTGRGVPDGPGWRVRAFPNRFPVVDADGDEGATGTCEVVVFSPVHDAALERLPVWHVAEVLTVLRDRVALHLRSGRTSPQVFVNHGGGSGASIAHPHAQIIALDVLPPAVVAELDAAAKLGEDPLDADLRDARNRGLVAVDGDVSAWCPWTTPEPFVVRIAPAFHAGPFAEASPLTIDALARTLRMTLAAMVTALDGPAYNVIVYVDAGTSASGRRWRVEVVPRLTSGGGFERGAGAATNASDPRLEAEILRECLRGEGPTPSRLDSPGSIEEAGR